MEKYRERPGDDTLLSGSALSSLALELGFAWDALGAPAGSGSRTLMGRVSTDAEYCLLQMNPIVPLAILADIFGGGLPTLLWSDYGTVMAPMPVPLSDRELDEKHRAYVQCLHVARSSSSEILLGEPVDLVLLSRTFDNHDYECSLTPSQIGALFVKAPRALLTNPKCGFDRDLGHKVIVGFGYAQAIYFYALQLKGVKTQKLWSPEEVVRKLHQRNK